MTNNNYDFFRELVYSPSPSGYEFYSQKIFRHFAQEYSLDTITDLHGNVIVEKKGLSSYKLMLIAHIDEVGFIVKYIDENGFIYFKKIGGIDNSILQGLRVNIYSEKGIIKGIIGKNSIHSQEKDDLKFSKSEDLWIDIGTNNKKETELLISVGDIITYEPFFEVNSNGFITANSTDDKAGIFVISQLIKLLHDKNVFPTLYFVSSVQEEIGIRGAKTSAYNIFPDICIAIDVAHSTDYPSADKRKLGDISLGKGPIIAKGANISPKLFDLLKITATSNNIDFQIEALPECSGTDIREIQTIKSGVATALISIPNRYMHTPNEIIHSKDLDSIVELILKFIVNIDKEIDLRPIYD